MPKNIFDLSISLYSALIIGGAYKLIMSRKFPVVNLTCLFVQPCGRIYGGFRGDWGGDLDLRGNPKFTWLVAPAGKWGGGHLNLQKF